MKKMEVSFFIMILKPAEHHWHELMPAGEEGSFSYRMLDSSNSLKLLEGTQDRLEECCKLCPAGFGDKLSRELSLKGIPSI